MSDQRLYRWRDVIPLMKTMPGRYILGRALNYELWPLIYRLARTYRRLVIPHNRIIAVTGSFGKTTTVKAISSAMSNCHNTIDFNQSGFLASRLFGIRPRHLFSVMEVGVSKKPGFMKQHAKMLKPEVAVATSIGSEHCTAFPSLEDTRREKAELLKGLPADGLAVVNGDDQNVQWMAELAPCKVVRFGYGAHNDVRADEIETNWPRGTNFRLLVNGRRIRGKVPLVSRHALYSVLAAVAVGMHYELDPECILDRLAGMEPVEGRMMPQKLPNGVWLLRDEFKGTKETVAAAMDFLPQAGMKRIIAVIGNISEQYVDQNRVQREMGERVGAIADRVLFIGHNFKRFRSGAIRAGLDPKKLTKCGPGLKTAVKLLKAESGPGDVIFLKSKGTQRFSRIALALMDWKVNCDIPECKAQLLACKDCSMLTVDWSGLPKSRPSKFMRITNSSH